MQTITTHQTSTATETERSFARVERLGEPLLGRTEALAAGHKFYCTGLPCKYGHVAERRVSDKSCMECRRIRNRREERERAAAIRAVPPPGANGRGTHLCGVQVHPGELIDYVRLGKLPYRVVVNSGLLSPAFEDDITAFYIREGLDKRGRLTSGVYRRECGSQVASFIPGFPRAVGTIKDLFDAAFANRKCFEKISDEQLRELYAGRDLFPRQLEAA